MEKETDQGIEMVKIWCGFYLWKIQGMCWQGKMYLGTLEVSLRDFNEELCLGFSRVYEDWWMIRLQDWTKMRIWLWKWGIWLNYIGLGIFCGQKETSSDANISQVRHGSVVTNLLLQTIRSLIRPTRWSTGRDITSCLYVPNKVHLPTHFSGILVAEPVA